MTLDGSGTVVIEILAGLSLAACCGLRAFLPPFLFGLIARLADLGWLPIEPIQLSGSFHWLKGNAALIVFGSATLLELIGDKVPIVDHLLDLVQTLIRPLSGALVFAAALSHVSPLTAAVVGLIAGGGSAAAVHLMKAKIRLLSTLSTGGLGTPLLSFIEDLLVICGVLLAIFLAVAAALLILGGTIYTIVLIRKFVRRAARLEPESPVRVR